jgi:hypothetical protein
MAQDRPHGRKRTGANGRASSIHRRGSSLGTGRVGNADNDRRPHGHPGQSSKDLGDLIDTSETIHQMSGNHGRRKSPLLLILLAALVFGGGGFGLSSCPSGDLTSVVSNSGSQMSIPSAWTYGVSEQTPHVFHAANDTEADASVSPKARDKYVTPVGEGRDTVTVLVYLCGADLESRYGMATSDLNEMAQAASNDQVRLIVQTGGASRWQNNIVSSDTVQRYRVVQGGLQALNENVGDLAMTDPDTLADFVSWGTQTYPADRTFLILWDHGGGSVTGYGYDENYPNQSMRVDQIADALKASRTKFDFIGFDACLMANMETAIAMEPYADYLIASEETEPGSGWYYTDWLNNLTANPSISTLDLGKTIVDTYMSASAQQSSASATTLSLTDLAELSGTLPEPLSRFSKELKEEVKSDDFEKIANARAVTKEFSPSSRLDQVDLYDFADQMDTEAGKELSTVIADAVKYNGSNNISDANGLSIYFPYRNLNMVGPVESIYENIGFDEDYAGAVRSFATLQGANAGAVNASSSSLFDMLGGAETSNGNSLDAADILGLMQNGSSSFDLGSLLGGSAGVDSSGFEIFPELLGRNMVHSDVFRLSEADGKQVLKLSEEDWKKIHEIQLSVWVDDGAGYIDLGRDAIYNFDGEGNLLMDYDQRWLTINGQPVSFYILSNETWQNDAWTMTGYIPAMLNERQVRILVQFDEKHPDGEILGAQNVYETGTESKGLEEIRDGDVIDFLCDYYSYEGSYQDSYYLGEQLQVDGPLQLADMDVSAEKLTYGYVLTDNLNSDHWTPMFTNQN